jgi:hypothetical protein
MSFSLSDEKNNIAKATVLLDGERHPEWKFRVSWLDDNHVVATAQKLEDVDDNLIDNVAFENISAEDLLSRVYGS